MMRRIQTPHGEAAVCPTCAVVATAHRTLLLRRLQRNPEFGCALMSGVPLTRRRYKTFTYVDAAAPGEPAPSPAALEGPPPSPQRQPPGTISLRCTPNLLAASTGAHEWSAGLKMAELCLSRPELFAGGALALLFALR